MRIKKHLPGVLGFFLAASISAATAGVPSFSPLPLGNANLSESRATTPVAAGVTYTRIDRGQTSVQDVWIVDVAFKASRQDATELAGALIAKGYEARVERVTGTALDDIAPGPLGFLVRVGQLATEPQAIALRDRLAADGYTGLRVVYSGEDGRRTTGPWVVHVLEVDPKKFDGTIAPALATDIVPERELLTDLATRTAALAASNGGYFVIGAADGTPGDLAGISVINGSLVSEAVDGRTSLILPRGNGDGARVAAVASEQTVRAADGKMREIDGMNRKPGLIRGCGGDGGDTPTEAPKHDFTCKDDSELILFTPVFGAKTEPGIGFEAILDASGRVTAVQEMRGAMIPAQGSVLSGTEGAAEWLRAHARIGARLLVSTRVTAEGRPVIMRSGVGIVNGGPRLLRNGRLDITASAEGFHWAENPEFYYRFGIRRNPRTLAGVKANGNLLFVAVDGRQPGYSLGASFDESARILRTLGVRDGLNLDGGGSTGMTVGAKLVNQPSDASGERPIGDGIVILP